MSLSGYQRSSWDCEERNEFTALTFRFSYYRFLSICCIPHAVPLDISLQHLWKSTTIIASRTTVIWIIIIISAWNCWLVYFLSPPSECPLSSSPIYFPWIGEFLKTVRWNDKKKKGFIVFHQKMVVFIIYFLVQNCIWTAYIFIGSLILSIYSRIEMMTLSGLF